MKINYTFHILKGNWKWNVNFTGGAFEGVVDDVISPFGYKRGEGIDAGFGEHDWICDRDRAKTDPLFESLNPVDGKITGAGKFIAEILAYRHFLILLI